MTNKMNNLEQLFVPYELALELKELGFDEPCFKMSEHRKVCEEQSKPEGCQLHNLHCGYPHCTIDESITPIPLPIYQQAFKWFREKYNIDGFPRIEPLNKNYGFVIYNRRIGNFKEFSTDYARVEEAELACLRKLIEIAKEK